MISEFSDTLNRLRSLLNADLHGFEKLRLSESDEYYSSVCMEVAEIISLILDTDSITFYVTGIIPGYFSKIAQMGNFQEEEKYSTNSSGIHFLSKIQKLEQHNFQNLKELGSCEFIDSTSLVFYLFGRGEIFGFIIVRKIENYELAFKFFAEFTHEINAIIADQAFSHRMNTISSPLLAPIQSEGFIERFGKQVAELTTRGFGADGGTFRIYSDHKLSVIGSAGQVSENILAARQSGEHLSGLLFESDQSDWAAIILSEEEEWRVGGIEVPDRLKDKLRANGLYSVLMCKLYGTNSHGLVENYGTLSYYFLRTTAYSRRDVSLFKSFADRVSAYLSMYYSYTELQQQNDIIELQGRIMTFSEVANLLAHDIWHKSNALTHDAENLESLFRRNKDRGRISAKDQLLELINGETDKLVFSANALQETTRQYKKLQQADEDEIYRKSSFSLSEVVDDVEKTLRTALDRRSVTIKRRNISPHYIQGPKFLFEQVIYNLCINAIDSISAFGTKTRGGHIEVTSHVDADKHIIRFSDSGPGIDYVKFPDIRNVFDIGKTTKRKGSGTGLTIARQLIGSHFSGDLQATTRRPATFTIVLPR
ncbi:signal transduction histidine kinase [Labrenzia sp. EL_195]|nr:signal transduction histidine kinase [Labrenzia sp. EL_195]